MLWNVKVILNAIKITAGVDRLSRQSEYAIFRIAYLIQYLPYLTGLIPQAKIAQKVGGVF